MPRFLLAGRSEETLFFREGGVTIVMKNMLFPHYLDVGSEGAAVDALHLFLCALAYGNGIIRDGKYGDATVTAVKHLQVDLGLSGADVDGNFGPKTREALKRDHGLDVEAIPGPDVFAIETRETLWVGPAGQAVWCTDAQPDAESQE